MICILPRKTFEIDLEIHLMLFLITDLDKEWQLVTPKALQSYDTQTIQAIIAFNIFKWLFVFIIW